MYKNCFIVVTYKKMYFSESKTLNRLKECDCLLGCSKVVIWNNGPNNIKNDIGLICDIYNELDNAALSVAYNSAIHRCESLYYTILDDDTDLDFLYVENLMKNLNYQYDLIVPYIKCGNKIVSPVLDVNKKKLDAGLNPTKGFRAIGSGLTFSRGLKLCNNKVFDERFSFYGVDTKFCYDVERQKKDVFVLTNEINHEVAGFDKSISLDSYVFREKNLLSAMVKFFFVEKDRKILYMKRILLLLVKYIFTTRNLDILPYFVFVFKRCYKDEIK